MGVIFEGWRRKTGCVTLLIALTVLAAWGRSQIAANTITIPIAGGVQYQATLSPTGFCFQKTRTITVGNNETLSYRDGEFITTGHNEPNDGKQSHETVDAKSGQRTGMRVLGLTNPGVTFTTDGSVFQGQDTVPDDTPYVSSNGNTCLRVLSISGPTSVVIDCGQTVVPYWSLITPLTLITAVLLLTKSRVAVPKNSFESNNDKNA